MSTAPRPGFLLAWLLVLSFPVAGLFGCATRETDAPGSTPQTGSEIEFTTASGLSVRMLVNRGSGLFASNVFVGAGSTRETDATAGSSHFLEHLLFNGTNTMTQEELYAATDRIGAYNNATTRQEYTHFMMVAPNEELDAALGIQAAMLLDSTLPTDKFEKERGIVIEEMTRDADSPGPVRQRRLAGMLWADQPDFLRPVLGTLETISKLDREDVLAYYHSQYIPSNMKLLLMGDFDPVHAQEKIEELFAATPDTEARPAPSPVWPEDTGYSVNGEDDELVTVVVQLPAPGVEDPDNAAMNLIADVLGGGKSSRLQSAFDAHEDVQIQNATASITHLHGGSLLELRVEAAKGTDTSAILEVMLGELATVSRTGLRALEWTQARNRALAESIRQVEQLHYYALFQGDVIWHSSAGYESRYQAALANSYPEIPRVAKKWFQDPVLKIAITDPGAKSLRQEMDPAELGYIPREDASLGDTLPGEGKLKQLPPVVQSVQPPSITVLDNGLTVIHSASPSTRMFALHVLVRDRSAREPEGREGIADLLHRCLPEGAGNYDREEFAAMLDGIGAQWKVTDSAYIPYDDYYTTDPRFSFIRLDCVDLYWAEALRLTGLMLGNARLDPDDIDQARTELAQRVRQDEQRSSARARAAFKAALYGADNPLAAAVFGTEDSLEGVDQQELRRFALDYLDPGQLILSVVGNIDREAVLERLRETMNIGGASANVAVDPPTMPLTIESSREVLEIGGKQANLRMGRVIEIDPADRWALKVATMVASNRMQQDLRETRGWAYSLGISMDVEGNRAAITARIGTRPEIIDQAEAAVREWLACGRIDADQDEIAAAVNSSLGRARMRRVTSIGQAYNLGYDLAFEGSLDADKERNAGLRGVTPEDVAAASEKYFAAGPQITVVAR